MGRPRSAKSGRGPAPQERRRAPPPGLRDRHGVPVDAQYAGRLEDALRGARATWQAAVREVAASLRSAVLPYLEQHDLSLRPDRAGETWYVSGAGRKSVDPDELPPWLDQLLRVEVEPGARPPDYLAYYLEPVRHAEATTRPGSTTGGEAATTSAIVTQDACSAGLVRCGNCEAGFRRVRGIHVGSQRLGMIPDTPCQRVFAAHGGNMTDDNARPWMAYVDGETLCKKSGDARRFASSSAAYRAACAAAPKKWDP